MDVLADVLRSLNGGTVNALHAYRLAMASSLQTRPEHGTINCLSNSRLCSCGSNALHFAISVQLV